MTLESNAVFLSYASEDATVAARIADALKAAGIEVWFDQAELRGGDAWDLKIRQQIRDCALFMPLISAAAQARVEGYFRREWRLAVDRTLDMADGTPFLVPVVIDSTADRDARVPEPFHAVQWTRLRDGVPTPGFVTHVLQLLSPEAPLSTSPAPRASRELPPLIRSAMRPTGYRFRMAIAIALVLGAIGVGYVATHRANMGELGDGHGAAVPAPGIRVAERSIAVLPFADLSEHHDQEYFADGMAEEILSLLAGIPDVRVISRTSSFQFKGSKSGLPAIGAQLGAAYIVEGSVRRFGDRVRVTAQLSTARDGTRQWSETYDSTEGDVLRVQRGIATAIARELRLEVAPAGSDAQQGPANVDAYRAYLRGLHAMNRFDGPGLQEAVGLFEHALELDPSLLRARERLAQSHYLQMELGSIPVNAAAEALRQEATRILAQDDKSTLGHALLAELYLSHDFNWAAADREARRALALGSNNSFALYAAADLASVLGRWDESGALFRRALSVDPLDADTHSLMGWMLNHAGRPSESIAAERRSLEIAPARALGHYDIGVALLAQGKIAEAQREFQVEPEAGERNPGLAMAYYLSGQRKLSDAALSTAERESADGDAYVIACAHAVRGEKDAAFQWLDRALEQRDRNVEYVIGEWALHNLVADPRYDAFLRKMNLRR